MSLILLKLEPRFLHKHSIVLDEFEEPNEIIFVMKGCIVVGYEINKIKKYCLKIKNKIAIGAFGATFHSRSEFVYAALCDVHAYAIRKANWYEILETNAELAE